MQNSRRAQAVGCGEHAGILGNRRGRPCYRRQQCKRNDESLHLYVTMTLLKFTLALTSPRSSPGAANCWPVTLLTESVPNGGPSAPGGRDINTAGGMVN